MFSGTAQATLLVSLEGVYSTGQVAEGGIDPNYILIGAPDTYPNFNELYPDYPHIYAPFTNGYPFIGPDVPWVSYALLGAASEAHWIAPQRDYRDEPWDPASASDPPGIWEYQTSYYIQAGVDPTTALLYGAISSDNCTLQVLVNGVEVSGWWMQTGTCLGDAHYFQIGGPNATWTTNPDMGEGLLLNTSAFLSGYNTITFVVSNFEGPVPNPTGLIVWLNGEGQYTGIPEVSTVALMLTGLAGLAAIRRRKKTPSA